MEVESAQYTEAGRFPLEAASNAAMSWRHHGVTKSSLCQHIIPMLQYDIQQLSIITMICIHNWTMWNSIQPQTYIQKH